MHLDEPVSFIRSQDEDDAADVERMRRLRLGDPAALEDLIRAYWTPLVQYVARLLDSADVGVAEDVAQETFVALWRQRSRWSSSALLRRFLFRIARNLALKERRRLAIRAKWAWRVRDETPRVPTPLDVTQREELRVAFERALAALPPRRREAFVLVRYHKLSLKEVAEVMGIAPQTVANQVTAAIADLRMLLADFSD